MSVYEMLGPKRNDMLAKGITLDVANSCVRDGVLNLESADLGLSEQISFETTLSSGTGAYVNMRPLAGRPHTIRFVIRCGYLEVVGSVKKLGKGLTVTSASALSLLEQPFSAIPDRFVRAELCIRSIPF